ncbi:preprotein translocase subunit SecD [Leminorella richardii]|uniref:Protein translocase subunit SecD n=2 Tax=Leminorella richardii TaxID=158841 RepID=A0A2X4XZ17_9GAMM|nr:preprotein translocase subunit SecD [Leminorella richardii]
MLIFVICIGLLYALPNLYGEDPAIQISGARGAIANQTTLGQAEDALTKETIAFKSSVLEPNGTVMIRFDNTDVQLRAREVLMDALGDKFVVALNLAPTTPAWMSAIGAEPMKLGLDLRGGVHFLMEVDMETAMAKLQEQTLDGIESELQSQKIPFSEIAKGSNGSVIGRFPDADSRTKAIDYLTPRHRDLVFTAEANNSFSATMSDERLREAREDAIQQNTTILRNRVNQLGVAEPVVQRQGAERIVVELPGIQDTARAKEILGATATLEFRLVNSSIDAASVLRGRDRSKSEVKYRQDGSPVVLYKKVVLTGDHITYAQSGMDQNGRPKVDITLDSAGGDIMSNFTKDNIYKPMATLFVEYKDSGKKDANGKTIMEKHEEVINVATIQDRLGNKFQITGISTPQEARTLSELLRAGALIAPIQIVEERTIGPSMGQQNIEQGLEACFWGLMVSVIFMLLVYRFFGIVASMALLVNVILIVGTMSLLPGATLSMPGIAGIVLTVGMAVDANVLINERIKEELKNGRSVQQAIHEGYNGAFSSILDANLTTLITAAILYAVGTGSIKGFAITLSIGVLTSMFTAIVGTRAIVNLVYGGKRVAKLSI